MLKYIFGPVPSRRLGMSLGVDLVPKKICTLDCVYCEIGKTNELTVERKEYCNKNDIIEELSEYFRNNIDPDYITFSGSGEPTLNIALKEIIEFIKHIKPKIPIAVLTNGTLFYDKNVRESILKADVVLPSLDAATEKTFKKINRPHKSIKIDTYIQGLVEFRQEFKSRIHLEIFILPGYNDHREELMHIKEAVIRISPDEVHLNTLDRPGVLPNLRSATHDQLQQICDLWNLPNTRIISSVKRRENMQSYRTDIDAAILDTISRRPCTVDDLSMMLGIHVNEVNKYLGSLEAMGRLETIRLARGIFYQTTTKADDQSAPDAAKPSAPPTH